MFPIFFNYEKSRQQYIYTEQTTVYEMSLMLMLKFKRYLRESIHPKELTPISKWYSTLQNEDLKEVVVRSLN